MITIRPDWTLEIPEEERKIGWAGENEVEQRVFVLPPGYGNGWAYRLDLRLADGNADIVLLELSGDDTLVWEITDRHLQQNSAGGNAVFAQIRASKGDLVKKSAVARFVVVSSINAPDVVEINPSEIMEAEKRMDAMLEQAQEAEAGAKGAQAGAEAAEQETEKARADAEAARDRAEEARDKAEADAGQTEADREATGKDRAEVEKLAGQARADAAQVAADKQTVAGDRLAAEEARTDAEAAQGEAARQAELAKDAADVAEEAIAAFTNTTLPDAVQQVTQAGAAQVSLAEEQAERALDAAERAEAIDSWTKAEADDRFANALRGTVSGKLVSLTDVSPVGALTRAAVLGVTTETGEGEKSPENPYTLSGAKPTAVTMCGRNLFDFQSVEKLITSTGADAAAGVWYTLDKENEIVYVKYGRYATGLYMYPYRTLPAGTYTFSAKAMVMEETDGNKTVYISAKTPASSAPISQRIVTLAAYNQAEAVSLTFTLEEPAEVAFSLQPSGSESAYVQLHAQFSEIQLEEGGAATAFEPYMGQTIALPEGLELHGGFGRADEYDAASGTLNRRWGRLEFDGTENWWRKTSGGRIFYALVLTEPPGTAVQFYCSHFQISTTPQDAGNCYMLKEENTFIIFIPSGSVLDTLEAFKAWMAEQAEAGTPVTVVYMLAEPEETALGEPARLVPPAPAANIYADAGTVEVVYNRDVNIAFEECQREIAELKSAVTALLGG